MFFSHCFECSLTHVTVFTLSNIIEVKLYYNIYSQYIYIYIYYEQNKKIKETRIHFSMCIKLLTCIVSIWLTNQYVLEKK